MNEEWGFTGTQNGQTDEQQLSFEDLVRSGRPRGFHHGDCVGADEQSHSIVRRVDKECVITIHPPSNPSKRAWCEPDTLLPEDEYLNRNHDIVDATQRLIATPSGYEEQIRSGTWATVRYARKMGKPVTIIWPDGSTDEKG